MTAKKTTFIIALTLVNAWNAHAAINLIFTGDDETLSDQSNGYYGGYYGSPIQPGQWTGNGAEVQIADGVLRSAPTSGFRGAAYLLAPASLGEAGSYSLVFDVTGYSGDGNDSGQVSIWSGSGYDLTGGSADALWIDTEKNSVTGLGDAITTKLASFSFQSTLVDQSIAFDYDGSSAIVVMLGAQTGAHPFPTVDYDNVRIGTTAEPIPEASTTLWAVCLASAVLIYRRKEQRIV